MALSKSERTTQYILETVAPVFSKKGYVGTSLSDLTKATGLTKGAIYGNFKNKDDLALAVYNYSLKQVMRPLTSQINAKNTAIDKLKAMTDFYRLYYPTYIEKLGGCPIMVRGIDAKHLNPQLFERTKTVIEKLKAGIEGMIEEGKQEGTLKKEIQSKQIANRIYAMMQGSIYLAATMEDHSYINEMMDYIDQMIDSELVR